MIYHMQIACNTIFTQMSVNAEIKKHSEVVVASIIKYFVQINEVVVP